MLTLEADTGSASILVDNGSHEFQLPVELGSNTSLTVAAGTSLAFNNILDLNGFTLSIFGTGTVDFNNAIVKGGGNIVMLGGGNLLGGSNLGGLLTVVPEPTSAAILLVGCLLIGFTRKSFRHN